MDARRGRSRSGIMSETTPESGRNPGVSEPEIPAQAPAAEAGQAEAQQAEAQQEEAQHADAPAAVGSEPQDDAADVENPPSEPVSARGHVSRPAEPAKT